MPSYSSSRDESLNHLKLCVSVWSGSQEEGDDKKRERDKKKLWVQVFGGDEAFQGNARKKISDPAHAGRRFRVDVD